MVFRSLSTVCTILVLHWAVAAQSQPNSAGYALAAQGLYGQFR